MSADVLLQRPGGHEEPLRAPLRGVRGPRHAAQQGAEGRSQEASQGHLLDHEEAETLRGAARDIAGATGGVGRCARRTGEACRDGGPDNPGLT